MLTHFPLGTSFHAISIEGGEETAIQVDQRPSEDEEEEKGVGERQ